MKVRYALGLLKLRLYYFVERISRYRQVIRDQGEIFAIRYKNWVHEAKESFRFHLTTSLNIALYRLSVNDPYHDNIAGDIIRIMFARKRNRREVVSPVEEKRTRRENKRAERGLILHVEDKSSGELLKHSI